MRLRAGQADERFLETMHEVLHGLCQPLTALQCKLGLGELSGEAAAMHEAICQALGECTRLNGAVATMRELVVREIEKRGKEHGE
jgi:hypothetical protein